MTYRITRFSPLQAAKMLGILYGVLGLVFMPLFLLGGLFGGEEAVFGAMFGLFIPVCYALIGVVSGAVGSVVYNLIAGWIGGLEFDLTPIAGTEPVTNL